MSQLISVKKQRLLVIYLLYVTLVMGGTLIHLALSTPHSDRLVHPRGNILEPPSIAEKDVFKITRAFSQLETRASYLFLGDPYNYKMGKAVETPAGMKALTQERMAAYDEARGHLKGVLEKAIPQYDKPLQSDIQAFLTWLNQHPASALPLAHQTDQRTDKKALVKRLMWSDRFNQLKKPIFRQLRARSGFADIENPEEAAIMLAVPSAKEALKRHPNDPTLCTVMTHWKTHFKDSQAGRNLMAQQIAFFEVGEQYCPHYFSSPSAWGDLYEGDKLFETSTNRYDKLTYKDYYNKELLPRLVGALKSVKKELSEQGLYAQKYLCEGYPLTVSTKPRDPKEDAKRLAYKMLHIQKCKPPKLRSFNETSLLCLMMSDTLCKPIHKCDTIQRCAKQTKPIIKS